MGKINRKVLFFKLLLNIVLLGLSGLGFYILGYVLLIVWGTSNLDVAITLFLLIISLFVYLCFNIYKIFKKVGADKGIIVSLALAYLGYSYVENRMLENHIKEEFGFEISKLDYKIKSDKESRGLLGDGYRMLIISYENIDVNLENFQKFPIKEGFRTKFNS